MENFYIAIVIHTSILLTNSVQNPAPARANGATIAPAKPKPGDVEMNVVKPKTGSGGHANH